MTIFRENIIKLFVFFFLFCYKWNWRKSIKSKGISNSHAKKRSLFLGFVEKNFVFFVFFRIKQKFFKRYTNYNSRVYLFNLFVSFILTFLFDFLFLFCRVLLKSTNSSFLKAIPVNSRRWYFECLTRTM